VFFKKRKENVKKSAKKIDNLITWLIIGWAIGWVFGVYNHNKNKKSTSLPEDILETPEADKIQKWSKKIARVWLAVAWKALVKIINTFDNKK